jgi:hypothetical protein
MPSLSGIENVNVSSTYKVEYPDEEDPIEPLLHDMPHVPYSRSSENEGNILNRTFGIAAQSAETVVDVLNRTFVLGKGEGSSCTTPTEDEKCESEKLFILPEDSPILCANYGSYLDTAPHSGIFDGVMQRKVRRAKLWQDTRPASKKTRRGLRSGAPKSENSYAVTKEKAPPRIKGRPAPRSAPKMTRRSLVSAEIRSDADIEVDLEYRPGLTSQVR